MTCQGLSTPNSTEGSVMPRPGCAMAVFWQPWVAGSLRGKQTSMAAAACTLELVAWRSAVCGPALGRGAAAARRRRGGGGRRWAVWRIRGAAPARAKMRRARCVCCPAAPGGRGGKARGADPATRAYELLFSGNLSRAMNSNVELEETWWRGVNWGRRRGARGLGAGPGGVRPGEGLRRSCGAHARGAGGARGPAALPERWRGPCRHVLGGAARLDLALSFARQLFFAGRAIHPVRLSLAPSCTRPRPASLRRRPAARVARRARPSVHQGRPTGRPTHNRCTPWRPPASHGHTVHSPRRAQVTMSAHTRKLDERRARAAARRAEMGAENTAPQVSAPWAMGSDAAPKPGRRCMQPQESGRPFATDEPQQPPTPRDLAKMNAARSNSNSGGDFFTGGGQHAPQSTGKRQHASRYDSSADLIGGPSPERRPARSLGATVDARAQYAVRANAARGNKRGPQSGGASYGGMNGNGGQNVGNSLGDRNSTRVMAPPGGFSSITFG